MTARPQLEMTVAELLDAVNESMRKATDHARYPTAALVALTQAVLEVGEQLRIANRLAIAWAALIIKEEE